MIIKSSHSQGRCEETQLIYPKCLIPKKRNKVKISLKNRLVRNLNWIPSQIFIKEYIIKGKEIWETTKMWRRNYKTETELLLHQVFKIINSIETTSIQFSSITQSCQTLCHRMDYSMPGYLSITNSRSSPKPMSIESVMPSNHLILCHPLLLLPSIFPTSGSFLVSQFFASGGQSIGVSASASVLPMNSQVCFAWGWTSWISLQSKGLSRVFFNTTVQKLQFFGAQLSL